MPLSGQTTVNTAGTAVPLGSQFANAPVAIKALTTNTGLMYVGNDGNGDVDNSNGYPLAAGDMVIFEFISNLDDIMIDASVNGEKVAWLILSA